MRTKNGKVLSVCRKCGAVGNSEATHCVFCGAALEENSKLKVTLARTEKKKSYGSPAVPRYSAVQNRPVSKPAVTALGALSLAAGILAVLIMAFSEMQSGFLVAVLAVVFGAVNLGRKQGGGFLSGIGIGLGGFVILVQGFWNMASLFFLL